MGQLYVPHVRTSWPSSDSSNIQLLGIFQNDFNITKPTSQYFQSRAMFKAAILLAKEYNIKIGEEFLGWKFVDTDVNAMNTLSSACELISSSNIVGIVGPMFSVDVYIVAAFAANVGIPVISYAATAPELSDRKVYPTFYRTVASDSSAALAITELFIRFNWTSCIIIYQNGVFGSGGANAISESFKKNNLIVTQMIMFDIATFTIQSDLKSLLTGSSSRIIILWAGSSFSSIILQNALDSDVMGPQFTWILCSNVPLNFFDPKWHSKLIGMLTVEPTTGNIVNEPTNQTLLNAAYQIWQKYEPESFPGLDNVDTYALFAFDATWSLIQSFEQLCSTVSNYSSSCISIVNSSTCFHRYFLNSSSLFPIINKNTFVGVSGPVEFYINTTDRIYGNYYIVKNVQSFSSNLNYVPVLTWSSSDRWRSHVQSNKIIWPGNSEIVPTGYASISGVKLRIAIIEAPPFTMTTEVKNEYGQITKKQTGYVPDLIEQLRNKMGFIPNIIWVPSNHSYNGLIDKVANNIYDMVVGDVTIVASRREKVGFSTPIFDNSLRIIVQDRSIANIDFSSFLNPFSFELWLVIFGAVLWYAILIYLFERQNNKELQERSIIYRLGMSMRYGAEMILGQNPNFQLKTSAGRLLTVNLFILSVVLIAAYNASLTSTLTISKSKEIIDGIDDIKNGKILFNRIGILSNSSIEEYFLREITQGSRNYLPLRSEEEIYDKLLNNIIDVAIMDADVLEYRVNNVYCNLTLVGTAFDPSSFGIVLPKKWIYQQDLDVTILSLRESNVFDDLKTKWFKTSYCARSHETSTKLRIESVVGLFLMFIIISIISIILFFMRTILYNKKNDHKNSESVPTVPNISVNARWTQNGVTVAGGHGQGNQLDQLNHPHGFYVDEDRTILIADSGNHRIMEWEYGATSGQVVAGGNGNGNQPEEMDFPIDVFLDKETDSLIICERNNRRVVCWPRRNGTNGETIIADIDCWGLVIDDQRFIYVADCNNSEIKRYSIGEPNGTVTAGGNGKGSRRKQLNNPTYVFVDQDYSVYVSDSQNHRVMKWMKNDKKGIVVVGGEGKGNDLTRLSDPSGVVVDQLGTVYVAEFHNHRVTRWRHGATKGNVIVGGNGEGDRANQLNGPRSLSFDRYGNLYVVDSLNNRIQRFDIKQS